MFLLDLIDKDITGKDADAALDAAHITVNKNAVPNDPRSPFVTSGVRMGTPAITTRGLGTETGEIAQLGGWIADVLDDLADDRALPRCAIRSSSSAGASRCTPDRYRAARGALRCTVLSATTPRPRSPIRGWPARVGRCAGVASAWSVANGLRPSRAAELVLPRLIKRDRTREPFDEVKLRSGILRALEKRPVRQRGGGGVARANHPPAALDRRAGNPVPAAGRDGHGRTAQTSTRSRTCALRRSTAASRT